MGRGKNSESVSPNVHISGIDRSFNFKGALLEIIQAQLKGAF